MGTYYDPDWSTEETEYSRWKDPLTLQCGQCQWDAQEPTQHFIHTSDRQKMGKNSYQVQPGSSQDLRALSQWKVMKILWVRRFSDERAETHGSSGTCPIVTAFHRAEPVISDVKAPQKTRACELEAKPSALFIPLLFLLLGTWAIFQVILCNSLRAGK